MIKNLKLSQKLTLFIIIGSIVPLLITSFIGYSTLDKVLGEKTINLIKEKGTTRANEINQWLIARKDEVEAMANVPIVRKGATPEERIAYTAYNFYRMKNTHENIYDAQWSTDAEGNFIFAAPDHNGGVKSTTSGSIKERDYWKNLIVGKTIISKPIISKSTGELAVVVAAPIKGYDGQIKGSVGNNILLQYINNTVKDVGLSEHSFAVLTRADGTYIIHPDKEMVMTKKATSENDCLSQSIVSLNNEDGKGWEKINYKNREKIVYNTTISEADWTFTIVADYDELFVERKNLMIKYIATFLIIVTLIIIVGYIIIRNIKNPIRDVKNVFAEASSGDLSARAQIYSKDEIGELSEAFNKVMENINKLIRDVKGSSNTVLDASNSLAEITNQTTAATNDVAQTMDVICKNALNQSRDTEECATNTNELANDIQEVSNAIEYITKSFDKTIELDNQGLKIVELLTNKTQENDKSNDHVRKSILEVDDSMGEIGIIVDTISQIADQTNLLALNAAIEAARAGKFGRGFAVVSDEIRKLAEESSSATERIRNLINGIKERATNAVDSMNIAMEIVKEQNMAVKETENVFKEISNSIETLTGRVKEINTSSGKMMGKRNEMVKIIENISASSEETAASTQQVSASAEEQLAAMEEINSFADDLKVLAQNLENGVNEFTV